MALDKALAQFSTQCDVSVGMPGKLPRVHTQPVSGLYTVQAALDLMLAGSGLRPVASGKGSFRLQAQANTVESRVRAESPRGESFADVELSEVIVTGSKREQNLRTAPLSMAVIDGGDLAVGDLSSGSRAAWFHDAAVSSTHLGPGRDRQFIRGVADSAFPGPSQATVSVQFDESRATYDGPDPDLALLDVTRVEILKGPQGPLYGTGALGGVFHIVPTRPDAQQFVFSTHAQIQGVAHGDLAPGADLVFNAPVIPGSLAVRAVGYASTTAGWINNEPGRSDANDTRLRGGRVALRGELPGNWIVDAQAVAQRTTTADSQYVVSEPGSLSRSNVLPEPHDNDFKLASLTAQGRMWNANALFTTSYISHETSGVLDASLSAARFGELAPLRYVDQRHYRLLNQEARLFSDADAHVGWLAGLSYMDARSDSTGVLDPPDGDNRQVVHLEQQVGEAAAFGEVTMALPHSLRATAGLRLFRSEIENEGHTARLASGEHSALYSWTPSASLDWRSQDERRFVYLRYARAVRPGGLNISSGQLRRFLPDELSNVDLGTRLLLNADRTSIEGALFGTHWNQIQSDYLLFNGLIGTRNAGSSLILGVEGSVRHDFDTGWRVEGGAVLQRARLDDAMISTQEDRRLPVVPEVRLRASVDRSFTLGSWNAQLRGSLNYVGSSRLSFDPVLDRKTGDYVRGDFAAQLQRGSLTWTMQVDNAFGSRADTFAYGNPFSIRTAPQYTPVAPRTLILGLTYSPAR